MALWGRISQKEMIALLSDYAQYERELLFYDKVIFENAFL